MDIIRDMEALCRRQFLLITEPEPDHPGGGKYSPVRCIGLCHRIFMAQNDVAQIMGLPPERVDVSAAEANRFQWLMEITRQADRRGPVPAAVEKKA
jgi:alpha-galactosidase